MYWSTQHKKKELMKEYESEILTLKRDVDSYRTRLIAMPELQKKVDIYEKRILHGTVSNIGKTRKFGFIDNDEYGSIFFHASECNLPNLGDHNEKKSVSFQLRINGRGMCGVSVVF